MGFEAELEQRIKDLITDRLGEDLDAIISIESIEIIEADSEIRILVEIKTDESPEKLAKRYFGLTGKVREALGERWGEYFPVITPNIERNIIHA